MARKPAKISDKIKLAREKAETSLIDFIRLVAPQRVLGSIHEELIEWWTRSDAKSHQLSLLPRAHQKSVLMAYRVAWEITKDPTITILYISSTSGLAEKQLKLIKDILSSNIYSRYWPEMIHPDVGKREKWTNTEICVDHPLRAKEGVRDSTVFTAGLTTNIVGLHCEIAVMDDVVTGENAYTEEGRRKVRTQYSLLSSIENPNAREWVIGTRYHPKDLYQNLMEMEEDIYDDESGEILGSYNVYEIFERQVETAGDGTGEYLWPRQRRYDGKWFGFNQAVLAKKKAQYLDKMQFFSQYYNNPHDPTGEAISHNLFQYYEQKHIKQTNGYWYYRNTRLNIFAAIDFAFSLRLKADYTAIVVIGIDHQNNIYVLDIERFKTDSITEYFNIILKLHSRWNFRKLRAEVTVAQEMIVNELKNKIREYGLVLSIDKHRPTRHEGTKEERIQATLEPRYENQQMWHYKGGNCQMLEEELVVSHPAHDDIKDALTSAIEIAVAPMRNAIRSTRDDKVIYHSRFGGMMF